MQRKPKCQDPECYKYSFVDRDKKQIEEKIKFCESKINEHMQKIIEYQNLIKPIKYEIKDLQMQHRYVHEQQDKICNICLDAQNERVKQIIVKYHPELKQIYYPEPGTMDMHIHVNKIGEIIPPKCQDLLDCKCGGKKKNPCTNCVQLMEYKKAGYIVPRCAVCSYSRNKCVKCNGVILNDSFYTCGNSHDYEFGRYYSFNQYRI